MVSSVPGVNVCNACHWNGRPIQSMYIDSMAGLRPEGKVRTCKDSAQAGTGRGRQRVDDPSSISIPISISISEPQRLGKLSAHLRVQTTRPTRNTCALHLTQLWNSSSTELWAGNPSVHQANPAMPPPAGTLTPGLASFLSSLKNSPTETSVEFLV